MPKPRADSRAGGRSSAADDMSALEYAVVVPTLGTRASLHRCLARVRRQTVPPAEIIVCVPHGVTLALDGDVRLVRAARSTSRQRNAGVDAATSPIVLFLDDDVMLEPEFGGALLATWRRYRFDDVSAVVAAVANDPTDLHVWRRLLRAAGCLSHAALLPTTTRLMASGHLLFAPREEEHVVHHPPTHCISYRRDLFARERYDESFDGYVLGEDYDLAARMARHGVIVYTPAARAWVEPNEGGLGGGGPAAFRRGRMYAYFRARHRRRGAVGRLAWEWANAAEAVTLAGKGLVGGDGLGLARAYLAGLHEARGQLRAELS